MSTQPSNRTPFQDEPPPYTELQQHSNSQQSRPDHRSTSDLPYVKELSNTAHPSTYTLNDTPQPDNSRKSMWQKLKEENEARKAKKKHVTHEQAAKMLGHDEEWQRERNMGSSGKDGWERDPIKEDRWWGSSTLETGSKLDAPRKDDRHVEKK